MGSRAVHHHAPHRQAVHRPHVARGVPPSVDTHIASRAKATPTPPSLDWLAPLASQVRYNFVLATYASQEAMDTDDGSSYYKTHDNFFVYATKGRTLHLLST